MFLTAPIPKTAKSTLDNILKTSGGNNAVGPGGTVTGEGDGRRGGVAGNRGWSGGTESYLTVFDSTADFVELDDCRVEG